MVTAFALITAEFSRIHDLAGELAEIEGVAEVYSVAGDEDLVAVVRVRDHEEVARVVTERIATLAGIRRCRTEIAFRAYGRRDVAAMWDLGTD